MRSGTPPGRSSLALSAAFLFVALLVLASIGYAAWIVLRYWDTVGV